ncbi:hypothetical protein D3C84_797600 [compost metagenome]
MRLNFTYEGQFYSAFTVDDALAVEIPVLVLVKAAAEEIQKGIDAAVARARARNATRIEGQDSMYLLKANEAERYIDYVLLKAEAEALQITPQAQAERVIEARDSWLAVAARIEAARIGGKGSLTELATVEAVVAAGELVIAELDAI